MDGSEVSASESDPQVLWQDDLAVFEPSIRPKQDFLSTVDRATRDCDDVVAFVECEARDQLIRQCGADTSREHGGILLGEAFRDEDKGYYVVVREVVPAHGTAGSPVHLQFQADSWQLAWNRLQEEPSLSVVGWYHTHPGLGVFLSGTDMKTQRLYFSKPWQLAIVRDPIRNQTGYFVGKDGTRCEAAEFRSKQSGTHAAPSV